jgi:uncharacterized membrane protein
MSEILMSAFVLVTFPEAAMIRQGADALRKMHAGDGIRIHGAAAVAKDPAGKLSVVEITKEGFGGTSVGALIGALAGLPSGPLAAAIGAAGGALIGNSADLLNQGNESEFAEKISRELAPGKAAIVAEVSQDGLIAFEAIMEAIGGTVVRK